MDKVVMRRYDEIVKKRPAYKKAKEHLSSQIDLIKELIELTKRYQPGDPAEKAVYVLSQLHYILKPYQESISTIKSFETLERNYQKLRKSLPEETSEEVQEP